MSAPNPPAILTEGELRGWLRALGLSRVRLNRNLDKVQYIAVPNGVEVWTVQALISGAFAVAPYRSEDAAAAQCCLNNDTGCYDAHCGCACAACQAVRARLEATP